MGPPRLDQPFVTGTVTTAAGTLPQVSSKLTRQDHWGTIRARLGISRMHYTVDAGLYALGNPDADAPVFASANYKMSFDALRSELPGRNAWILVLDTRGINVWCAAGKGTFGTAELIERIEASGLAKVVSHRTLILPQLAGPGVAAHEVKRRTGFTVRYGPIRARDLVRYLNAGMRAAPSMRRKTFTLKERCVLIPLELYAALKTGVLVMALFVIASGIVGPGGWRENMLTDGAFAVLALASAIFAGAVLTPVLLPYLPGRAFSLKGFIVSLPVVVVLFLLRHPDVTSAAGMLESAAWALMVPAIAAYLAMNFTGASTYTSLSGVKKEMRWALPIEIGAGVSGLVLWLSARFVA